MSRNLLILAGGIIAILVVVSFVYVPAMDQEGFNFRFSVIGEDENGDPVTIPFSFWINGVEVVNLRPTASWTCTGDGLDWSTLIVSGEFRIYRLDYSGRLQTDITPSGIGRAFVFTGLEAKDKSTYFSIPFDSLLSGVLISGRDTDGNDYWNIQVTLDVHGSVDQESDFGDPLTDGFSDSLSFTVKWIDGSFSIGGGITR